MDLSQNVASAAETRQKWPKKRSLHDKVNEHFEAIFNEVSASAAILRIFLPMPL
jgi:hypothetical protein